jgi:type II secretory pathway pseudopilin PulG
MTSRPRLPRTRRERGFSSVELAVAFAVVGSLLAVAVPTFLREVRASRFVEPTEGLATIAAGAVAYALTPPGSSAVAAAFPRSVALTPAVPPRGHPAADPDGTWSDPTWRALHFPPTWGRFAFAAGEPHSFSFAFESTLGAAQSTFVATAHGDLDGDGAVSTFEVRGRDTAGGGPVIDPGMYVEAELE